MVIALPASQDDSMEIGKQLGVLYGLQEPLLVVLDVWLYWIPVIVRVVGT